jgi:hypothetical protein
MAFRVKVTRPDFDIAESDGWVDGLLQGRRGLYVYVELGKEMEYVTRPSDDPMTEYRIFRNCSVFFANTREQLDTCEFDGQELNVTVIIYR